MPEGHVLHRLAREHEKSLADTALTVSSPQGRARAAAADLDGTTLLSVEALGKHLFYRSAAVTLHVHLGLFGRFRSYHADVPPPRPTTRLRIQGQGTTIDLIGPTDCRIVDRQEEETIRERLGPDPLREDGTAEEFAHRLSRRRIAIGAALLDQRVIAGVGNIFRAEALFVAAINPLRSAASVPLAETTALWKTIRTMMRNGVRLGRIVSRDPVELGLRSRGAIENANALYVYKLQTCLRCGGTIASAAVGGRSLYWCPSCQS
ncbi:MAG: DNA-formamidopyrimidine glycosylase family protein [Thermoleophilia bacterium]